MERIPTLRHSGAVGKAVAALCWLALDKPDRAGPLLAAFGGVLVIGRFMFEPELPLYYAAMLLLALIAAVGRFSPPTRLSARVHALVRIALCVAALALTAIPAARDFAAAQAQSESNPYLNFQP